MVATSEPVSEEYMSTDDREMAAYRESMAKAFQYGEVDYLEEADEDAFEAVRAAL